MTLNTAAPIETDAELAEATAALQTILRVSSERPGHPLDSLARSLLTHAMAYEAEHFRFSTWTARPLRPRPFLTPGTSSPPATQKRAETHPRCW